MTQDQIMKELNSLTSDYRFIRVIAAINFRQFCGTLEELSKKDPFENLNYNEYKFLIGLWLKNHSNNSLEEKEYVLSEVYVLVHELLASLHRSFVEKISTLQSSKKLSLPEVMNDGDSFKEAFFYSGVGGYDDQYVRLAVDKYSLDDTWIKDNKGFSIKSTVLFFDNIRTKLTQKLNNLNIRKTINVEEGPVKLFSLTHKEIVNSNEEFNHILENFSTYYGSDIVSKLDDIADYNAFSERPIIKLNDGNYFIAVPFSIAEAIYETPFYWMNNDETYSKISLKNRGEVGESITLSKLSKVFGSDNVFRSVDIKKNKSSTATDIDVLVSFKKTGVIFQVKAKKLTALSKRGDIVSIRNDFNKAVESAFLQGKVCKESILNPEEYKFITKDGIDIKNELREIKNVYIICIVLDEFPAISHAAQTFLYNKYPESTIALSTADLDMICRILQTPERVVDYFRKRIENCRYYISDSETSFLGYYINHDLKPVTKVQGVVIDPTFSHQVSKVHYAPLANKINKPIENKKVGRNKLCPCGSGEKYKKCCLLKV